MPPFEFYQASKIMNDTRIFIRDLRQTWYQTGLLGISSDIEETVQYLKNTINQYSPESVTMIGNSMGGFAALLFSNLVGDSRAIAFVPQTFISPIKRVLCRDWRWQKQIFNTYKDTWLKRKIWNLANLAPKKNWRADLYVSRQHRLDYLHCLNISEIKGVTIHEYDVGGHTLVRHLKANGELAQILRNTTEG